MLDRMSQIEAMLTTIVRRYAINSCCCFLYAFENEMFYVILGFY
ncbi:hypothetical protein Hanom_Chr08g00734051 [Helianthus anomalus]